MPKALSGILFIILSIGVITGVAFLYPYLFKFNKYMLLAAAICLGGGMICGAILGFLHNQLNKPFKSNLKIFLYFAAFLFIYLQWAFTTENNPINAMKVFVDSWNYASTMEYKISSHHGHVNSFVSGYWLRIWEILEIIFLFFLLT